MITARLALLLCVLSASAAAQDVTVMTFNIRWFPKDEPERDGAHRWANRKAIVAKVIRERKADIVGLQEASAWHMADLAKLLPEYSAYNPDMRSKVPNANSLYILYLKSRFRVDTENKPVKVADSELPKKDWGPGSVRVPIWVRLIEKTSGKGMFLFNVHHDHRFPKSRAWSARLLARKIAARKPADPVVVTGDFNASERSASMTYLKVTGKLLDSFRLLHPEAKDVGTGHGFRGGKRVGGTKIDHVLISKGVVVTEALIDRTNEKGIYPSDHYPVLAKLRLRSRTGAREIGLPEKPETPVLRLIQRGGWFKRTDRDLPDVSLLADGTIVLGDPAGRHATVPPKRMRTKLDAPRVQALLREIIDTHKIFLLAKGKAGELARTYGVGKSGLAGSLAADHSDIEVQIEADGKTAGVLLSSFKGRKEIGPEGVKQLQAIHGRMLWLGRLVQAGGIDVALAALKLVNARLARKSKKLAPLGLTSLASSRFEKDGGNWMRFYRGEPIKGGKATRVVDGTLRRSSRGKLSVLGVTVKIVPRR